MFLNQRSTIKYIYPIKFKNSLLARDLFNFFIFDENWIEQLKISIIFRILITVNKELLIGNRLKIVYPDLSWNLLFVNYWIWNWKKNDYFNLLSNERIHCFTITTHCWVIFCTIDIKLSMLRSHEMNKTLISHKKKANTDLISSRTMDWTTVHWRKLRTTNHS